MKQLTLAALGMGADVATSPTRVFVSYRSGDPREPGAISLLAFAKSLMPVYQDQIPVTAGANWPRVTAINEDWWYAYRNDANVVTLVKPSESGQTVRTFAALYGNEAILLENGMLAYQTPKGVFTRPLANLNSVWQIRVETKPTGLSYLDDFDDVIYVDDDRETPYGTRPHRTFGLTVYEGANRGCVCRTNDGQQLTLWPGLDCFTPRCAEGHGGWYVVTYGPDVRLAFITLADFADQPQPQPPQPEPVPPTPHPQPPTPEPTPLPTLKKGTKIRFKVLRSYDGHAIAAEGGGGGIVSAIRKEGEIVNGEPWPGPGPWEEIIGEVAEDVPVDPR